MISVIIPVYNAEACLRRCLDSILNSTCQDFELILVNDGSADKSWEICREYAARDGRVRLISQENQGVSAARNRGLEAVRGEWVVFVDADDAISPDFLDMVALEENRSQDLLLFDFVKTEEALVPAHAVPEPLLFGPEDIPELLRRLLLRQQLIEGGNLNFVSPWAKAYRKSLIDRFSIQFSPKLFFAEDKLFNAEFLTKAERCAYRPVPVYFYNIHPDSSSQRFHPGLPYNLADLLEQLCGVLEASHAMAPLERDFYSYALETLSYSLVRTVFSPKNPQTCHEKREVCRTLRESRVYVQAMKYNHACGHWVRRTLILLLRLRWYFAAGILSRLWYYYLSWRDRR